MKFKRENLLDIIGESKGEFNGLRPVSLVLSDTSRWEIHYDQVFEYEGKFYETYYSVGATETQDQGPYEYDDDEIECIEVVPVEKTVIVYKKVE